MEDFPKWFLRIMVVVGIIAFGSVYWMRHDWSKGWAPSFNAGDYGPPPASAPEPAAPAATAPAVAPAAAPSEAARPTAAPSAQAGRASTPCQPIGRTAKGELVYSMDCRALPAQ
ncbi:hypothetical protein OOZ54_15605 [Rhodopseudomonas palustris]|uniref:hypothetical protein n=1 Tax=Rhodopseudomonas palustris TaxID=1076 RepID=UPI000E5C3304|nr:hypothetical protein [Rhodopseudomonas palustris]QLH71956.1 hypothetical protein HZF03_14630 [Rhodopseudomonas palustris]RHZ91118.1 hypothetical protein D1920_23480 [Rhodopseudomonas palustris]WBU28087.1 hypothetical protein OOZ54_15605 [Rhodopseudomonas palustris]